MPWRLFHWNLFTERVRQKFETCLHLFSAGLLRGVRALFLTRWWTFGSVQGGEFHTSWTTVSFWGRTLLHGIAYLCAAIVAVGMISSEESNRDKRFAGWSLWWWQLHWKGFSLRSCRFSRNKITWKYRFSRTFLVFCPILDCETSCPDTGFIICAVQNIVMGWNGTDV